MPQGTLQERLESSFLRTLQSKVDKVTERPSDWIEKNFWIPDPRDLETGDFLPPGPIRLTEFQRRIVNEALARNADGKLKYTTVVYSTIKKSGKSAVSAAVALYKAYERDYANVYCMANDGRQSEGRLYDPIQRCLKLHQQHKGPLKGESPNKTDVTLSNGSKIEAITVDAKGEAGSQPYFSVYCFDEETEILTRGGWKKHDGLDDDTIYATVNSEGVYEWQKAEKLHRYAYTGEMVRVNQKRFDLLVTPNHDIIHNTNYNPKWRKKSAEKLYGRHMRVPSRVFGWAGEKCVSEIVIPATKRKPALTMSLKQYIVFMAWYLSEGCVKYKKRDGKRVPECVMIGQSKTANPKYYDEIWKLFEDIGLKPSTWAGNESIVVYNAPLSHYLSKFGLCYEKYIPELIKNLDREHLQLFLTAYVKGDGWISYGNSYVGTTSCRLADDFQEIGIKLGFATRVAGYPDKRSKHLQYKIAFYTRGSGYWVQPHHWSKEEYDGVVFCPTTKNGSVIVRRNKSAIVCGNSELWGYDTDAKKKLWTEMTIPPTLFGHAQRWVETYAGESGKSELLEQLYDLGTKSGSPHPDFKDLVDDDGEPVVWVNESASLFCYWDHVPRMIWQESDYYAQEAKLLTDSEFRRIHRNEWVSPVDTFVDEALWSAVKKTLGPIKGKTPVVLGVDAAISNDYAAIVGSTRDPDSNSDVAIRFCYMFTPKSGGGRIKISETIEPLLRTLVEKYNVVCVAYDKYQLEDMAQRLRKESLVWMYDFSQMAARAVADKNLQSRIINKTVWWDAQGVGLADKGSEIPSLYQHITKAGAKRDSGKLRLVKLSDKLKIDGAVAASMAVERCTQLQLTNRENDHFIREHTRGEMSDEEFTQRVQELKVNA